MALDLPTEETPVLIEYAPNRVGAAVEAVLVMALDEEWSASSMVTEFVSDVVQVSTAGLRQARQSLDEVRLHYAINAMEVNHQEDRIRHLETAFAGLQYTLKLTTEALQTGETRRTRLLALIDEVNQKYEEGYQDGMISLVELTHKLEDLRDLPEPEGESDATAITAI